MNITVQRYPYAKHSVVEQRVTEFVEFAIGQRLQVSKTLIQERDRMIAQSLGLDSFKASMVCFQDIFEGQMSNNRVICSVQETVPCRPII